MLADDINHDADILAGKPLYLALLVTDAIGGEAGLDLLGAQGFVGVTVTPHNVGNAADFVKVFLDLLAGGIKLEQSLGNFLEGQERHGPLDAALLREHGPAFHRDHGVIHAFGQDAAQSLHTGIISAGNLN